MTASDTEFLARFEAAAIPAAQWTHRARVRVAFLYLRAHPFDVALQHIRTGVKALNAEIAVPERLTSGYHETVTVAWARLIVAAMRTHGPAEQPATARAFLAAHPHLSDRYLLRRYYSHDRLVSWAAKQRFVAPDLEALPA